MKLIEQNIVKESIKQLQDLLEILEMRLQNIDFNKNIDLCIKVDNETIEIASAIDKLQDSLSY